MCVCSTHCEFPFTSGASTLAADGLLDADAEGGWGDDADLMLDEGRPLHTHLLAVQCCTLCNTQSTVQNA